MDRAMELGDWRGFKKRRAAARKRGHLRGIGLCCYLETTSGYPRERADIMVHPHGRVDVVVGTLSSGQSHETTFAQCVAEWLGVSFDDVYVDESDTDIVKEGGGSHSARSMRLAGIVMGKASDAIIEKGKRIAAHMLETAEDDIGFATGRFTVKGTDRSVGIFDVAKAAADGKTVPRDLAGPLAASCDETIMQLGFPYGAHVCEVEIDPQTGGLDLVRYTAVDDVGRAVNPMIVEGQTHGGAAQGIGQALCELRLRPTGSVAFGVIHGLRRAARRHAAFFRHGHKRGPHPDQQSRRTRRWRRRHYRGARRCRQRRGRCAGRIRRDPSRNAGDTRAHLAGDSSLQAEQRAVAF
jgi:carbon-monoxide dehydrogenase large subunit